MVQEKSLYYYGAWYHRLFDDKLKEMRRQVREMIPQGATVLDIGCGTGLLCAELAVRRQCQVTGIDLSQKMLRFARQYCADKAITLQHADATDLSLFSNDAFDYACMLVFIHELPPEAQAQALKEALRVAPRLIIADSATPLPRNFHGFQIRFVEYVFGRDHWPHFKRFLAQNGIEGVLKASGQPHTIEQRALFWNGTREVVLLSRA